MKNIQILLQKESKKLLAKVHPIFSKIIRGTFEKWYQVCARKSCKCHKDKRNRHGPYYRISYFKGKRTYHIYVPTIKAKKANKYCQNYKKLWDAIEKMSQINISLLRIGNGEK